jgi:3-oxoacyl-[acyl-carrier-protein] synthase II
MEERQPARSVVITGLGCVTPIGLDVPSFWRSLLAGISGAAPIQAFDTAPYRTNIGCEVKNFRPAEAGSGRATSLALAAAREALGCAGLEAGAASPSSVRGWGNAAVSLGTTMGEANFLDRLGPSRADPQAEPDWREVLTQSAASITETLALELGLRGPQVSLPAACSAGNYAIGCAFDLIRQGEVELALAGGSEAFSESAFAGFSRLNALSPDRCRPFARNRQGLLIGEGAGLLVLESEEHARERGARILARVLGYGLSCDAFHITGPHPEGDGAVACMRGALDDAGIAPQAVGYICCHGTGTRHNDAIESRAIRRLLSERARQVPVSSIKALTGHMMGAASAVEAIACVLALREGVLPPTWNLDEQDPECDLDVIPNEPRAARVEVVLNNSYAFGGNNACVAFGRA